MIDKAAFKKFAEDEHPGFTKVFSTHGEGGDIIANSVPYKVWKLNLKKRYIKTVALLKDGRIVRTMSYDAILKREGLNPYREYVAGNPNG